MIYTSPHTVERRVPRRADDRARTLLLISNNFPSKGNDLNEKDEVEVIDNSAHPHIGDIEEPRASSIRSVYKVIFFPLMSHGAPPPRRMHITVSELSQNNAVLTHEILA